MVTCTNDVVQSLFYLNTFAGTRKSSCSCCMWGGGEVHEKEGPLMMGVLYQRC